MTKHAPRKRFGQHFLVDQSMIDAIVQGIAPRPGQIMVEIGPGLGAMTQPLVERLGHLTVIELDRDLAARLRERSDLNVIQADVLTVDFSQLLETLRVANRSAMAAEPDRPSLRVVGNLPYNISTPILFHLLDHAGQILDQHFMLQKEVVDRMVAPSDTSAYGRLSVMLQWRYRMDSFMHVPPNCFDPPPRVDSAMVRMVSRTQAPIVGFATLSELVKVAFSQRRKLLRHTLGHWLDGRGFAGEFDLQRRAQEVTVDEYIALAQRA